MARRRLKKATPGGPKKEGPGVKFRPPGGQGREAKKCILVIRILQLEVNMNRREIELEGKIEL